MVKKLCDCGEGILIAGQDLCAYCIASEMVGNSRDLFMESLMGTKELTGDVKECVMSIECLFFDRIVPKVLDAIIDNPEMVRERVVRKHTMPLISAVENSERD